MGTFLDFLKQEREEAIDWASGVMADRTAVILDTETTGLRGEVVELAIISVPDGAVLYNGRFNPICEPEQGAIDIHGLTRDVLAGEPSFADQYAEIAPLLTGPRVVIYNAAFDLSRLTFTIDIHQVADGLLSLQADCAMVEYARFFGDWNERHGSFTWQKLSGGDHSALGDCLATLELIKAMAAAGGES